MPDAFFRSRQNANYSKTGAPVGDWSYSVLDTMNEMPEFTRQRFTVVDCWSMHITMAVLYLGIVETLDRIQRDAFVVNLYLLGHEIIVINDHPARTA